jgi:hypothetical protein
MKSTTPEKLSETGQMDIIPCLDIDHIWAFWYEFVPLDTVRLT